MRMKSLIVLTVTVLACGRAFSAEPAKGAAPAEPPAKLVDHATFLREVSALPPDAQIAQVEARMIALNPGSTGKLGARIENGAVTGANPDLGNVADISPLRALATLKELRLTLAPPIRGKKEIRLADISVLRGLKLTHVQLQGLEIPDIAALQGMPLKDVALLCGNVKSIKPLAGAPLSRLYIKDTPVDDLSPVRGAPLESLSLDSGQKVDSLAILRGMPLKTLQCWDKTLIVKSVAVLRSIPTLETINKEPAAEVFKRIRLRTF